MTPFKLTLKNVVEANILAYQEKRLAAQRGHTECLYSYPTDPGCGCAMGVAMPPEVLDQIIVSELNSHFISLVRSLNVVDTENNEGIRLRRLQEAHDHWLRYGSLEEGLEEAYLHQLRICGMEVGVEVSL